MSFLFVWFLLVFRQNVPSFNDKSFDGLNLNGYLFKYVTLYSKSVHLVRWREREIASKDALLLEIRLERRCFDHPFSSIITFNHIMTTILRPLRLRHHIKGIK